MSSKHDNELKNREGLLEKLNGKYWNRELVNLKRAIFFLSVELFIVKLPREWLENEISVNPSIRKKETKTYFGRNTREAGLPKQVLDSDSLKH